MKTIKETLIGTMKNGKNILNEIAVPKKVGKDFSLDKNRTQRIVNQLHPAILNLKISEITCATKDAKTIRFVSEDGYLPPFEAGQYINVAVEIDGVRPLVLILSAHLQDKEHIMKSPWLASRTALCPTISWTRQRWATLSKPTDLRACSTSTPSSTTSVRCSLRAARASLRLCQ